MPVTSDHASRRTCFPHRRSRPQTVWRPHTTTPDRGASLVAGVASRRGATGKMKVLCYDASFVSTEEKRYLRSCDLNFSERSYEVMNVLKSNISYHEAAEINNT